MTITSTCHFILVLGCRGIGWVIPIQLMDILKQLYHQLFSCNYKRLKKIQLMFLILRLYWSEIHRNYDSLTIYSHLEAFGQVYSSGIKHEQPLCYIKKNPPGDMVAPEGCLFESNLSPILPIFPRNWELLCGFFPLYFGFSLR